MATSVMAQTNDITRFKTIHGEVIHNENAQGRSILSFVTKGNQVPMPADWKNANVDQVIDLEGETAILMSHTEGKCDSRMSLLVVTKKMFLGPYNLGECEDVMAYQKSDDGKALIAIRADKANGRAWVYSTDDDSFRGPVSIKLPASMAQMVPKEDVVREVPQEVKDFITKPSATPSVKKPTKPLKANSTLDPGESIVADTPPAKSIVNETPKPALIPTPAPVPVTKPVQVASAAPKIVSTSTGNLSKSDASKVVEEAKKTTAPQRAKIMIDL